MFDKSKRARWHLLPSSTMDPLCHRVILSAVVIAVLFEISSITFGTYKQLTWHSPRFLAIRRSCPGAAVSVVVIAVGFEIG